MQGEGFAGLPEHLHPFAGRRARELASNLPIDPVHLGRAQFERELRARGFGAVVDQVEPRRRVSTPDLPLLAAGADEAVADDVTHPHGQVEIVSGDAHREDSAAMEHGYIIYPSDYLLTTDDLPWQMPLGLPSMTLPRLAPWKYSELEAEHARQARLRSWQALGSQR